MLEELKMKQELEDKKKKLKQAADTAQSTDERESIRKELDQLETVTKGKGSIPGIVEAEETTNLYIGNLSPEVTEEYLCQQFGKFGHITSVKIMYPRTDEEKARGRHSGFVSFEHRRMAEAAKNSLDGTDLLGMIVRIGWGKAVSRPVVAPTPIAMNVIVSPVPALGSAVQAGVGGRGFSDKPPDDASESGGDKNGSQKNGGVYVKVPKNRKVKTIIQCLARYVSEDGHPFEQQIMEKEKDNELFSFLYDQGSDDNIYYRYDVTSRVCLLYMVGLPIIMMNDKDGQSTNVSFVCVSSVCLFRNICGPACVQCVFRWMVFTYGQGDTPKSWRTEPFPITFGGEMWIPPGSEFWEEGAQKVSNFSDEPLPLRDEKKNVSLSGGQRLAERKREQFENRLRSMSKERSVICDGMIWCLDNAECANEIADCLFESLTIADTDYELKMSRLFLLSDILFNSSCARPSAWAFRAAFERHLPAVFAHISETYKKIGGRFTIQQTKSVLMNVLRVWEGWGVYSPQFTQGLEFQLLGDPNRVQELCSSAIRPRKGLPKESDASDSTCEDEEESDPTIDGVTIDHFDCISEYPCWLRPTVLEWFKMDIALLERECGQKGLLSDVRRQSQTKESLVRRLVAYKIYYSDKATEESRKHISPFLQQTSPTTSYKMPEVEDTIDTDEMILDINTRELTAQADFSKPRPNDADMEVASDSSGELFGERPENDMAISDGYSSESNGEDIFKDAGTLSDEKDQGASRAKETPHDKIKRAKLRQVELEVAKVQDALEKQGVDKEDINLQCDEKRQELTSKVEKELMLLDDDGVGEISKHSEKKQKNSKSVALV
eukprot:GHVN01076591.1.p1 GENE.GHVN01076591.1~~GHVN01076591.1.p1  ORF type:complete len:834 (+),score=153.68 GHVN01076591.1:543-3044(+)